MELDRNSEQDAGIVQTALLDCNGNQTIASKMLGISRDRISTFIKKWDLTVPDGRIPKLLIDEIVQRITSGASNWLSEAAALGHHSGKLTNDASFYGYDCRQITAQRSANAWNGRVFGHWEVVTGTKRPHHVDVQCVCGVVKTLPTSNLLSHASRSCGCIGLKISTIGHGSQHFKWQCVETGEEVATTLQLAKQLQVLPANVYHAANRLQDYVDPQGLTWRCSKYQQTTDRIQALFDNRERIQQMLDSGISFTKVADEFKVSQPTLCRFAQLHGFKSNYAAKLLTAEAVQHIRELGKEGLSVSEISDRVGSTIAVIQNVIRGKTYANV